MRFPGTSKVVSKQNEPPGSSSLSSSISPNSMEPKMAQKADLSVAVLGEVR